MNARTAKLARPSSGRAARRSLAGPARALLIIAFACAMLAVAAAPADAASEIVKIGASGQRYVWTPGGC